MRQPEEADEGALIWTARRCTERPWLALVVVLLQLALSFGVYMVYGPWHSALTLVFLTAALTSWYGAFEYRLDEGGVVVRGPLGTARHTWDEFARWGVDRDDLRLRFRGSRRPPELVVHAPGRIDEIAGYVAGRLPQAD